MGTISLCIFGTWESSWDNTVHTALNYARSHICDKRLLGSSCLSFHPSFRPHGTLGSHLTDFYEIWHVIIFRKSVEKIQKANIHFRSSLAQFFLEWKMFHTKALEKIKINISRSVTFFSSFENRPVCEIMCKNIAEPDKPQMTIEYGSCALHAGYLRLQTHTQNMQYLLLFHANNGWTNAPQCYVIRVLPVVFLHYVKVVKLLYALLVPSL